MSERETIPELIFGVACCLGAMSTLFWLLAFVAEVVG